MLLCLLKQIIRRIIEGRKHKQEQTAPALLFSEEPVCVYW